MGASEKRRSIPDSNPTPSQTLYAVARGRIAAESSEALMSPMANSSEANLPANGFNATAASAASPILRWPDSYNVAAQATTMKNAITSVTMQPRITSQRDSEYCLLSMPFSTTE